MTREVGLRFSLRRRIRRRDSAFAQNWRKNSRECVGAFTSRVSVGKRTWPCKQLLATTRGFTSRRRVSASKDSMNRLYVVEHRFTLTGAMADHRLRCAASQIPAFAHALATKILAGTKDPSLGALVGNLQGTPNTFDQQWIDGVAADLMAKPGASLVLAGPTQPVAVQMLVYAINAALKNVGQTLTVRQVPRNPKTIDIAQLATDINEGHIKQLFIFGGDPVYNAPRGLVEDLQTKEPLDWAELQKKVPNILRLGYHEDATSALSQWHIPLAHYLNRGAMRLLPAAI